MSLSIKNITMAKYTAEHLESGIMGVNEMRPLKAKIPFGGLKRSGIGAEAGSCLKANCPLSPIRQN